MSRAHDLALVDLARRQRGLLTADDLVRTTGRADELTRRLRGGLWQEVLPGVVATAASPATRGVIEAAAMLWEPRSLLSHATAAQLEGIWVPAADKTWLTVPYESRRRDGQGLRVMRSRHFMEHFHTDGFLRWTTPARTVVDLGMCLTRRQLEAVLLSAIRLKKTTAAEVDQAAAGLQGRAGLQLVRQVTALWHPERESLLEDLLVGDVRSSTTEAVTRQHVLRDDRGAVIGRIDVAVEALRLAFEADGLHFHSTDAQIAADQARDRRFLRHGWQTVRFREGVLDDRLAVRREIRAIVERRRRDVLAA